MVMTFFRREPLLHFLALAVFVFVISGLKSGFQDRRDRTIIVTGEDLATLNRSGRELDARVLDEVLYREALRRGLHEELMDVRHSLVDRMRIMIEDDTVPEPVTETAVRAAYEADPAAYDALARRSISLVSFVGIDPISADADALRSAKEILKTNTPTWRDLGDTSSIGPIVESVTEEELGALFGPAFAAEVFRLKGTAWHGPLASTFGQHFVRIDDRKAAQPRSFEDVRDLVRNDLTARIWEDRKLEAYSSLVSEYTIIIDQ